jgi:hypothetical protein
MASSKQSRAFARGKSGLAVLCGLMVFAGLTLALAQDRPSPRDQPPAAVDPKACAAGERLQPGQTGPSAPPSTSGGPGDNLSDKLARTDGVLCPPNVGPDIRAPAPDVGRTPVIPPPGSPGGDPSVQPK